jgi:hypothetical protein
MEAPKEKRHNMRWKSSRLLEWRGNHVQQQQQQQQQQQRSKRKCEGESIWEMPIERKKKKKKKKNEMMFNKKQQKPAMVVTSFIVTIIYIISRKKWGIESFTFFFHFFQLCLPRDLHYRVGIDFT